MANPYTGLGIPQDYKKRRIDYLYNILEVYWKLAEETYSKEGYDRFITSIEAESDENKKREMLCNKLVEVSYHALIKDAQKRIDKRQAKLEKARSEGNSDEVIKLKEGLGADRKKLEVFLQYYEMINTEEKRSLYHERRIESQRPKEAPSYAEILRKHEKILEKLKSSLQEIKIEKPLPEEPKEELFETEEEKDFTKGKTTIEGLEQDRQKNKQRVDPENNFRKYTGYSYRWSYQETRNSDDGVLNEKNKKGEHVIAVKLGEFNYETLIQLPTAEYPKGKASYQGKVDIVGVSKLDSKGNLLRNDIVITKLNKADRMQNRYFLREVLFSDENIDKANLNNNGFVGNISHREDGSCYIEYNGAGDRELVTALELANHVEGVKNKKWYDKKVGTFCKIKEQFKEKQKYYVESIMKHKEEKLKFRKDAVWEK